MSQFNRYDIIEAHYLLEVHYNNGGWLRERPSNRRRMMSTHCQLMRMRRLPELYGPGLGLLYEADYDDLSDNGRAIYDMLEIRYGFVLPPVAYLPGRTRTLL